MLLTIVGSYLVANTMLYITTYILHRVELHVYIYWKKPFGEHCVIHIARDYETKIKIYLISSFRLNLFEVIVAYVYIDHL